VYLDLIKKFKIESDEQFIPGHDLDMYRACGSPSVPALFAMGCAKGIPLGKPVVTKDPGI